MKKLFALVMVLAMAFAVAVPALASGWDQLPTTPAATKEISIKITALETEENTSVLGSLYEDLSVMYPVVKGTVVHFFVEVSVPATKDLSEATWNLLFFKKLKLNVDVTNLEITEAFRYVNGTGKVAIPAVEGQQDIISLPVPYISGDPLGLGAVTYGYEYWAKGIEAGKDGVAAASIGFYNTWIGNAFGWDNNADGIDEYVVAVNFPIDPTIFQIIKISALGAEFIIFPVLDDKIDVSKEIMLVYAGVPYFVTRAVNGDITFRNPANYVYTPGDTTAPTYANIKAAFDSYFTVLGFGYADAKYMTEEHFTKYFGTIAETTVKITYPSGSVVVAPPTVEPPQTGDATTAIGFVMIALALVAAAVVTVRKVRA